MAHIGYARVSTYEQNLDLQLDALKQAGVTTIYEDKASGKTLDRPELAHCLKALRQGDTLTVWRLDRLGRTLKGLIEVVNDLAARGVSFRSLTESVDTESANGKLTFHMFAALAEFERDLVRNRTMAGLEAARARGKKGGRPRRLSPTQASTALRMMASSATSIKEIAAYFGVSRTTLYTLAARNRRSATH